MTHPDHGSTHAYGQDDIDRLRALGWVPDSELVEEVKPERKKPGPKPKVKE